MERLMSEQVTQGDAKDKKQKIKDYICDQIAEGVNLREICREPGMPAWRTVYDWIDADSEFSTAIARAREVGYHAIAHDTLGISDEAPERITSEQGSRIDPAFVAWQKMRVDQRMKLLAKWSPKRYGDRIQQEVTGDGGGPVQVVTLTPADYKAARAEMLGKDDV